MLDLLTVGTKFTRTACRAAAAAAAIDRYLLRVRARPHDLMTSANPPAAAAAVDRRDRRADGQTDTRPFYNAYYRIGYYVDRVIMQQCNSVRTSN